MKAAGFSEYDFADITPFISESKTTKDAHKYWNSWGKSNSNNKPITIGTLLYLTEYKKAS